MDVNGNASLPIECGNDFKIGSKMKFSFDMKTMDICKIIVWQVLDSTGNDIQNTWHLDSIQLVDNSYISLDGIHVSTILLRSNAACYCARRTGTVSLRHSL